MSNIRSVLIGNTIRLTWISSGATPSPITAAIFTGSETLVSSVSMTDSGNGHYFADYTVSSLQGYFVYESTATINSLPYKNRTKYRTVLEEVD